MKRVLFGTIGAIAIALSFASNAPAQTNTTIDPTTLLLQKQIKLQRYQLEQQQLQLEQQQLMLNKLMAAEIRNQADIKQAKADAGEARKQVALVSSRADTSAVKTATTVGSLNPGFGNIPTGPGWRSSDGSDEIQLGGLLQLDGGINNYHPGSSAVTFRKLTNNLNVRRGQISLRVTFLNDFKGFLLYDFGGVNDTLGASQSFVNSDGKTVATVTGNAIKTGFQDAILSYTGFKPFGTMTSIDLGYETPPITQDEAISPSQAMFMEHPVVDLSYVKIGAGNARGILGFRDYTNRYFGFFALSGPTSSALHDQSQTGTPLVAIGRLDYNIVNQAMTKVQIGGSFQRYLQTPGANAVSLGGLSEDFDDFASFIGGAVVDGTALNPITAGGGEEAEATVESGRYFLGGAYYNMDFEQAGLSEADFSGYYGQLLYSITGEQQPYHPADGGWGTLTPVHPFSPKNGYWGAWQLGFRYTFYNENSGDGTNNFINGGISRNMVLGINWNLSQNIRFQLNLIHGWQTDIINPFKITFQNGTSATVGNGSWDEIGLRSQFSF